MLVSRPKIVVSVSVSYYSVSVSVSWRCWSWSHACRSRGLEVIIGYKVSYKVASSAPVERIFSQSGLIMRPNRARMSNKLLEELIFLKCNDFWPCSAYCTVYGERWFDVLTAEYHISKFISTDLFHITTHLKRSMVSVLVSVSWFLVLVSQDFFGLGLGLGLGLILCGLGLGLGLMAAGLI